MMSHAPSESHLLDMYIAFRNFQDRTFRDDPTSSDMKIYELRRGDNMPIDFDGKIFSTRLHRPSHRSQRAMEREDEEAFKEYREEAMWGLEKILPRKELDRV